MPRYDDGDSENPDDISWFEDNLYDDGDREYPDNFRKSQSSNLQSAILMPRRTSIGSSNVPCTYSVEAPGTGTLRSR
jgi:hypothetical protein